MKLEFIPVRSDTRFDLAVQGDALIIDGVSYDFTDLADGCRLPREAVPCDILVGDVVREKTEITVTLIWPYGAGEVPGEAVIYDATHDGPVDLKAVYA